MGRCRKAGEGVFKKEFFQGSGAQESVKGFKQKKKLKDACPIFTPFFNLEEQSTSCYGSSHRSIETNAGEVKLEGANEVNSWGAGFGAHDVCGSMEGVEAGGVETVTDLHEEVFEWAGWRAGSAVSMEADVLQVMSESVLGSAGSFAEPTSGAAEANSHEDAGGTSTLFAGLRGGATEADVLLVLSTVGICDPKFVTHVSSSCAYCPLWVVCLWWFVGRGRWCVVGWWERWVCGFSALGTGSLVCTFVVSTVLSRVWFVWGWNMVHDL